MGVPLLQMFRGDTPTIEVGTELNPIDFGFCMAGVATPLAYEILLFNDKTGSGSSDDARFIGIELLRKIVTYSFVSTGVASQTHTMAVIPIISATVTVDGIKWAKVTSLLDYGQYAQVYEFDYTTGVVLFGDDIHGEIPDASLVVNIDYTPDTNPYGKQVAEGGWLSFKSVGVIQSEITIDTELASKIDDTHAQVQHYSTITEVIGVWDNPGKTGTNYYTGGSFNADSGLITLGNTCTGADMYVEYNYMGKDDNQSGYTILSEGTLVLLDNPIPAKNAKKLYFKVDPPANTDPASGVVLKVILKIVYMY